LRKRRDDGMLVLTAVFCLLKVGSKVQSGWAAPFDPSGSTKLLISLTAESLFEKRTGRVSRGYSFAYYLYRI
jgi:hypothetical protein